MILTFIGSMMFVVIGLYFLTDPFKINNSIYGNSTLIFIVGLIGVVFFGLMAVIIFRKLSDQKAGLIINEQGIIDNSSDVSVGLILWADIEEIKVSRIMNQKMLILIVRNPQEYLDKVANRFKKKTMGINYKACGSPINISTNSLQADFNDLHRLLT